MFPTPLELTPTTFSIGARVPNRNCLKKPVLTRLLVWAERSSRWNVSNPANVIQIGFFDETSGLIVHVRQRRQEFRNSEISCALRSASIDSDFSQQIKVAQHLAGAQHHAGQRILCQSNR